MSVAVYLPLLASIALAAAAPWLAGRLSPARGALSLGGAAVVTAAGTLWALALLVGTLLDDVRGPAVHPPPADPVALVAAAAALVATVRLAVLLVLRARRRPLLRRFRASAGGELVVLPDERPDAFAVPGRPGRLVVTVGMLRALDPAARQALFAHERAHLRARHDRLWTAVDLAAAVNPALIPVRRAVVYLSERWADERAARAVGDRRLVARALATAALAGTGGRPGRLAFGDLGVYRRVRALQSPAPAPRVLPICAAFALVAAVIGADVHATGEFLHAMAPLLR